MPPAGTELRLLRGLRQWGLRDAGQFFPARGDDGRRVFLLHLAGAKPTWGATTLAAGSDAFTPLLPAGSPVGFLDDRTLLILDRQGDGRGKLVRCDVVTGRSDLLLHAPSANPR